MGQTGRDVLIAARADIKLGGRARPDLTHQIRLPESPAGAFLGLCPPEGRAVTR